MSLLFLLLIITATATADTKNTHQQLHQYGLEDEIKEILENLRSTVQGTISVAFDSVENSINNVFTYRNNILYSSASAIRQQSQTFRNRITILKNSANLAGKNIDVCLSTNEPLLNKLADDAIAKLYECLIFADNEMAIIQQDTNYRVDTLMNEVHRLEFQLDLCANDLLCISSLITEVELSIISIPQKIQLQVDQAEKLCDELKVLIQTCMDPKVAQYHIEASTVSGEITRCVNNILSSKDTMF